MIRPKGNVYEENEKGLKTEPCGTPRDDGDEKVIIFSRKRDVFINRDHQIIQSSGLECLLNRGGLESGPWLFPGPDGSDPHSDGETSRDTMLFMKSNI